MNAILLVGQSNSGKTPLGEHLQEHRSSPEQRFLHLDFGEHLRRTLDGRFSAGLDDEESVFLRSVMAGRLLDDQHFSIARKIVQRFCEVHRFRDAGDILVLNGMPRHLGQARDCRDMGIDVRLVVWLGCTPEVALKRKQLAEKGKGHEDRSGRDDGSLEIFRTRRESFDHETLPMLDFYESLNAPIERVRVTAELSALDMMGLFKEKIPHL